MFKNSFLKFGSWAVTTPLLLLPSAVLAAGEKGLDASKATLDTIGKASGATGTSQDLPLLIGKGIAAILGVVGIVFVVLIVQSGIQYMTAGGDDTKVKEAKGRIVKAVIGIVIVLAAYSISSFVINQLIEVAK